MRADGIEAVIFASSGLHLIDEPDPVAHLLGHRGAGAAVAVLRADGRAVLLVGHGEPAAARVDDCAVIVDADPAAALARLGLPRALGAVGLERVHFALGDALAEIAPRGWDGRFDQLSAARTQGEIAAAGRATAIAEAGYAWLLARAPAAVRDGMRECDFAVEINLHMRALGAEDSFLMLNCLPRAPAVMPSSERVMRAGDLLLVELSPCVEGQFTQICRTVSLGEPAASVRADHALLVRALAAGIAAIAPGAPVRAICDGIDAVMAATGHGAYSRPPHLRRRGHGLGCGTVWPGDIAHDNEILLERDMLFVVHPNQFLPDAGYLMYGSPVRVGAHGAQMLGDGAADLGVVAP